tara:strand:+ start:14414 stop:14980 length:567 start_codon:yes stop_codon:yes gene_type:complete
MVKSILLCIFFSIYLSNTSLEKTAFNYSLNNNFNNISSYSVGSFLSDQYFFNYNLSWSPSENLIISTNFIENSKNESSFDNILFYNFGINILTKNMINYGVKINTLKFHKVFNTVKWNNYFIDKKVNLNNFLDIYLGISFSYSDQLSYSSLNFKIDKKIKEKIYLIFGFKNISFKKNFNYSLGLQYSL